MTPFAAVKVWRGTLCPGAPIDAFPTVHYGSVTVVWFTGEDPLSIPLRSTPHPLID